MLQHLTIKNLAIVSEADLNFDEGMTVITGETGAGKSILLDALNLVLGQRAEVQLIQNGQEKAEVTACFDISQLPSAVIWLNDLELNHNKADCIIRRTLYANGRSRGFINGTPATTQQLKMLGEYLIQMHGQHKHQLLLQPREQLRVLDAFGKHQNLLDNVYNFYAELEALQKQRSRLIDQDDSVQYQTELLQYQVEELETLGLEDNEVDKLYDQHDKLANAQSSLESCQEAIAYLDNEESGHALQLIHHAEQSLKSLFTKYSDLSNAKDCLATASIQIQEALSEIENFMHNLDNDPEVLHNITQRLDTIHDIARKHKVDPLHIHEHYLKLCEKLEQTRQNATTVEQIDEEIVLCQKQYQKHAKELSQKRKVSAKKLEKEISKHLQHLGMQGAEFKVACKIDSTQVSPTGTDQIVFCISTNAGHPAKPLHKVASGGEISRISLALELATVQDTASPTLIFDEVDVGIGGKTGAIVGQYLHQLSKSQQVVCITHLPQVAAFGDQHLQVIKKRHKSSTHTQVKVLSDEERIDEIARMLGGIDISAEARAQAEHLLCKEKQTLESVF